VYRLGARKSQREHCANNSRLHHRTESLIEIHTRELSDTTKYPTGLISLKGTIGLEFVPEDPLASDNVGPRGARYEIPCVILQKGMVFFFHSSSPVGVYKGTAEGLRHWREGASVVSSRHPKATL